MVFRGNEVLRDRFLQEILCFLSPPDEISRSRPQEVLHLPGQSPSKRLRFIACPNA